MSYANGPKIVTDGLVLCLDAANRKSYAVQPELVTDSNLSTIGDGNFRTCFRDSVSNITLDIGPIVSGKTYQLTWNVTQRPGTTSASMRVGFTVLSASTNVNTAVGLRSYIFTSNLNGTLRFVSDNIGTNFNVDFASLREYQSTFNDLSGNVNNGTLTNGTTFSADNGGVLSFDGSNDYISLVSPSDRYAWTPSGNGNNYITIDIWVKSTDGSGHFVSKPWNGSGWYNYRITNNTFLLLAAQSNSKTFSNLSTGNWENATVVVNPTQFAVYRNGSINSSFSNHNITGNTPGVGNLNLPLALMTLYPYGVWGGNTGYSMSGQLGIFKFYNRVLSPNEVQQNYNALKGRYGLT